MDLRIVKKKLRNELMERRRSLGTEARAEFSERICGRLIAEEAFAKAAGIFSFMPMKAEVQLDRFFGEADRQGKRLFFPVCFEKGRMEAYWPKDRTKMALDSFGVHAPDAETDVHMDAKEIDLVIVPMLGFDRELYRIGYGGGFYDRYLKRLRPDCALIGVCFADLEVAEIPRGAYDISLPLILTERERVQGGSYRNPARNSDCR